MPSLTAGVLPDLCAMLIFHDRGIVAESAAAAMVAAAKIQGAGLATIGLAGAGKFSHRKPEVPEAHDANHSNSRCRYRNSVRCLDPGCRP